MTLDLAQIKQSMTQPKPRHIELDEAVCFIAWYLSNKPAQEAYMTEFVGVLPHLYPTLRLSYPMFHDAFEVILGNGWAYCEHGSDEFNRGHRIYLGFKSNYNRVKGTLNQLWFNSHGEPTMTIREAIFLFDNEVAEKRGRPKNNNILHLSAT